MKTCPKCGMDRIRRCAINYNEEYWWCGCEYRPKTGLAENKAMYKWEKLNLLELMMYGRIESGAPFRGLLHE